MPKCKARCTGEWTINTLYKLLATKLQDDEKRYNERFNAQQMAIEKAERASEKRFDSVNEFRGMMADQQATLVNRNEWDAKNIALHDKIDVLTNRLNLMEGSGSGKHAFWGYIVGGLGVLSLIVTLVHTFMAK
jgi:PBP1b-binding outer membrane lipoprotein LpoB